MQPVITGIKRMFAVTVMVLTVGLLFPFIAVNADDKQRPERMITMSFEYPSISVPVDEDNIRVDIIFNNTGRNDEQIDLWITGIPEKWKARIKTYRFAVSAVYVPAGEKKTLSFEVEPGKETSPGRYQIMVEGNTPDGFFRMVQRLTIALTEKDEGIQRAKGIKVSTSYPVLRGPSDGRFEFSLEVESKMDKDAIFDLFAQGPEGWEINFKPAYETKYISSLRLKQNQNTSLAVEVKPALNAQAGEYPLQVKVLSGEAQAEADLTVFLTGTYNIEVGATGELLSLDAHQGKPANISLYVKNTGSAAHQEIKFMSFKPENWEVEFKPERLENVKPGELKQVEVIITPYKEALVGDYAVNVRVEGERVHKPVEFRVSVKASSAWAWIGIVLILAVILGLAALFHKLGRR